MPRGNVKITKAQTVEIENLYGSDRCAQQISVKYGISKSHVWGIWFQHRKRLGSSPSVLRCRPVGETIRLENAFQGPRIAPRELTPEERAMIEDQIVVDGKLLIELQESDCRWPVGRDQEGVRRFCGCPRSTRMYCEAHAPISISLPVTPPLRRSRHLRLEAAA